MLFLKLMKPTLRKHVSLYNMSLSYVPLWLT